MNLDQTIVSMFQIQSSIQNLKKTGGGVVKYDQEIVVGKQRNMQLCIHDDTIAGKNNYHAAI